MFFPERIKNIGVNDRVLEIGPGGNAFSRADVLLEKTFENPAEAEVQRGYAPELKTDKPVVYYKGDTFPFKDDEFDYVICSHVLEHVGNLDFFVSEMTRVAGRGYLEFPTIYYDYIYNIPNHLNFLFFNEHQKIIHYLPKNESELLGAENIQKFFFMTTFKGYVSLIDSLKEFMFQGFEWSGTINLKKTVEIENLTYDLNTINIPPYSPPVLNLFANSTNKFKRKTGQLISKFMDLCK